MAGLIVNYLKPGWQNILLNTFPPARPVFLLIDGHSTHVRLDVARKCTENGIILFALPPHTTQKLQFLNRGCFKPLKNNFRKEVNQYMEENPGKSVNRFVFGKLFEKVYAKSISPSTTINFFSKYGIFSYNPKVILESTDLAPSLVGNTEANITCISDCIGSHGFVWSYIST